jgi:signal peptidase
MRAPARGAVKRWAFRALLLTSLAGAVLAYCGPLFFELRGQTLFVLTSGSMGETYPAGSAVVAEAVTPDQLRVDQVITFKETLQGRYVTHRIVALTTLPRTADDGTPVRDASGDPITDHYVQTQGDGNLTPDPNLTPVQQVRYLVVEGYPELGSWLLWSRTLTGKVVLFAPPFVLLLLAEMWSWRTGRTRREDGERPPRRILRHKDVAPSVA